MRKLFREGTTFLGSLGSLFCRCDIILLTQELLSLSDRSGHKCQGLRDRRRVAVFQTACQIEISGCLCGHEGFLGIRKSFLRLFLSLFLFRWQRCFESLCFSSYLLKRLLLGTGTPYGRLRCRMFLVSRHFQLLIERFRFIRSILAEAFFDGMFYRGFRLILLLLLFAVAS